MSGESVLLADDEPLSRGFLQATLQALGLDVTAVADGAQAEAALAAQPFDFVFTDLSMPRRDGRAVLAASKAADADRPVVLVAAQGTMSVAVEAMRLGAADILIKPVAIHDLELCLTRLRERRQLLRENRYFRAETLGTELVVAGPAMRDVVARIEQVARSRAPVLVLGERGTGKELVAARLHRGSDRRDRVFVKLDCAAVPEHLLASELFGHEQDAFPGAGKRRAGRFELADGGTLFLDAIGEIPPALQPKLLRALQAGEFERVGSTRTQQVDVRIVAATDRDLRPDVEQGRFRADLLGHLGATQVAVPPLRERRDEIVPLARHFLGAGKRLPPAAEAVLRAWHWPGNVRELQQVMQRANLLRDGDAIDAATLRAWLRPVVPTVVLPAPGAAGGPDVAATVPTLVGRTVAAVTDELVRCTLDHCGGNRTRAAQMLGIGVRTLFNRLQQPTAAQR